MTTGMEHDHLALRMQDPGVLGEDRLAVSGKLVGRNEPRARVLGDEGYLCRRARHNLAQCKRSLCHQVQQLVHLVRVIGQEVADGVQPGITHDEGHDGRRGHAYGRKAIVAYAINGPERGFVFWYRVPGLPQVAVCSQALRALDEMIANETGASRFIRLAPPLDQRPNRRCQLDRSDAIIHMLAALDARVSQPGFVGPVPTSVG